MSDQTGADGLSRRRLLALAAASAGLTLIPPLRPARAAAAGRVLVLVELSGGNDGLNMLAPFADPAYRKVRPRLALGRDDVIALYETMGLNSRMEPLMPAWQARDMAAVLGVGYPDPNRSHFRSIEIWNTASGTEEYLDAGWVARLAEGAPAGHLQAGGGRPRAVALSNGSGPLLGGAIQSVTMQNPAQFARRARRMHALQGSTDNPALRHLLTVQGEVLETAADMEAVLAQSVATNRLGGTSFPRHGFGRRMETAAQLIAGGLDSYVLKVTHGGFDTHQGQRGKHDNLLQQLAEGLAAFRQAMIAAGTWDQVLVMTYSEFGRRVAENGSGGTDHGTSAPHLVLGGRVRGDLYGRQPSLTDLQGGDLKHGIDFRSLYATVARHWWDMPEPHVRSTLGGSETVPLLRT